MLSRFRNLLRSRRRDDAGITLGELVVSATVTMIMLAVATSWLIQINRQGSGTMLTNQTTGDARNALQSWTSMLRVAAWLDPTTKTDRFEEVTPTKIVFYANLGNLPTACPTNSPASCRLTNAATKVTLSLVSNGSGGGAGRLVEVVFGPDNTTPTRVRTVALNASATNGQPLFQPYFSSGATVPLSTTLGCLSNGTPVVGMCLQSTPAGAGMLDPVVAAGGATVTAGPLRGYSATNVDSTLQKIAGIDINFTVSDPAKITSMNYSGAASVYSGFAS